MTACSRLTPAPVCAALWSHAAERLEGCIRHLGRVGRRRWTAFKMGRGLLVGLLIALALVLRTGGAQAAGTTTKNILDLLYPQATGWTLLRTFPHPPPQLFGDPIHVETLGYFDRLQTGADRCSPMLRMFLGRDTRHRFRSANVFGPGDDDLVYAGQKPCAEGDWTIIWRHGLNSTAQASVIILDSEVQRIQAGPQPKAVGVAGGCCGDPWNYYCLYEPIPHESCTAVPGALVIPHRARPARSDLTLRRDVKLLPAPNATFEQDDPYQPPARTAGTVVEQLLTVADGAGRTWRLVTVAAKQGEVPGTAAFVVGWVGD